MIHTPLAAAASALWLVTAALWAIGGDAASEADVATAPDGAAQTFRCGDREIRVAYEGDDLILSVGEETWRMRPVVAASGAKYQALDDPSTLFWSKGDEALLEIRGQRDPQCSAIQSGAITATGPDAVPPAGAGLLHGGEWRVEEIGGEGLVEGSSVTMSFDGNGGLYGGASCNRYLSGYEVSGEVMKITLGPLTMMACGDALDGQEQRFLALLGAVERFASDPPDTLTLYTGDGRTIRARR